MSNESNDHRLVVTNELVAIILDLHIVFCNVEKVTAWLNTENLNFGGARPIDLINSNRLERIRQFIDQALEESER